MNHLSSGDYFISGPAVLLYSGIREPNDLELSELTVEDTIYIVARGDRDDILECRRRIESKAPGSFYCLLDRVFLYRDSGALWAAGQAFFEVAAEEYDTLISADRNQACAEYLLRTAVLIRDGSIPGKVLDFGCGTGLSALRLRAAGVDVVGYDCNASMREHARQAGLNVVNTMLECASDSIDIVVACYVMHFGVRESDALELYRVVPVGGVVLGNFHKGMGIASATAILGGAGFSVATVAARPADGFGPIILFRRDV